MALCCAYGPGSTHIWRVSWPNTTANTATRTEKTGFLVRFKNITTRNIELLLVNWKWYWHVVYRVTVQLLPISRQYNSKLARAERDVTTFNDHLCIILDTDPRPTTTLSKSQSIPRRELRNEISHSLIGKIRVCIYLTP